ncbi:MAG: class I SAM-dependent methyltransferase [Anaerolineales bacterium]
MTDKQLKANLIKAYNQQVKQRNNSEIEDWKVAERANFLALLQKDAKQILLEIGTGHGRDSLFFQEQGFNVTGIDISPAMVDLCRQKSISAHVMDVVDLSFKKDSFDAVYALNSFLHLPKSEFPLALENVSAVLRPTGLFYLGLYGGFDFEGIWDDDSYTPKRFFSFHSDENLHIILADVFEILYFRNIHLGDYERQFQSVILRKRTS